MLPYRVHSSVCHSASVQIRSLKYDKALIYPPATKRVKFQHFEYYFDIWPGTTDFLSPPSNKRGQIEHQSISSNLPNVIPFATHVFVNPEMCHFQFPWFPSTIGDVPTAESLEHLNRRIFWSSGNSRCCGEYTPTAC